MQEIHLDLQSAITRFCDALEAQYFTRWDREKLCSVGIAGVVAVAQCIRHLYWEVEKPQHFAASALEMISDGFLVWAGLQIPALAFRSLEMRAALKELVGQHEKHPGQTIHIYASIAIRLKGQQLWPRAREILQEAGLVPN